MVEGSNVFFRKEITDQGGTISIFASGRGKPFHKSGSKQSIDLPSHVARAAIPFDVPALALELELAQLNYRITAVDLSSTSAIRIQLADASDDEAKDITLQDWFFDPITYLPVRVEYKLPDIMNSLRTEAASCDFANFDNFQNLIVPKSITVSERGARVASISVSSVTVNSSFSPDFDSQGKQ